MIPTTRLPLPLGTTVLVTATNTYDIPTGTLAVVAHHVTDTSDPNHIGWPIIAYPDNDPDPDQRLQISVESYPCDPDALTVTAAPPPDPNPYISPDTAAHVLYSYGAGGYRPGDFTLALITALVRADHDNRARLSYAFPDYAYAVHLADHDPNGLDKLRHHMRAPHTPETNP